MSGSEIESSFKNMIEFEPYWWSQHTNRTCKRLHVIGSSLAIIAWGYFLVYRNLWFVLLGLVLNYGFAWIGHLFFEKNEPATFKYPCWS